MGTKNKFIGEYREIMGLLYYLTPPLCTTPTDIPEGVPGLPAYKRSGTTATTPAHHNRHGNSKHISPGSRVGEGLHTPIHSHAMTHRKSQFDIMFFL